MSTLNKTTLITTLSHPSFETLFLIYPGSIITRSETSPISFWIATFWTVLTPKKTTGSSSLLKIYFTTPSTTVSWQKSYRRYTPARVVSLTFLQVILTSLASLSPAALVRATASPQARLRRLRNISQGKPQFLSHTAAELMKQDMEQKDPSSRCAKASLIVLKDRQDLRRTVYIRPVCKFTVKHQYLMPTF